MKHLIVIWLGIGLYFAIVCRWKIGAFRKREPDFFVDLIASAVLLIVSCLLGPLNFVIGSTNFTRRDIENFEEEMERETNR